MERIEALIEQLREHAPDDPQVCGPDLEYDARLQTLELAARGTPERHVGISRDGRAIVRAAVEPDWSDVVQRARGLLDVSKDLRNALLLLRGLTRRDGLPGLREGLELLRVLVERQWACVHPRDEEGMPAMSARLGALGWLIASSGLPADIRLASLGRSPVARRLIVERFVAAEAPGEAGAPGEELGPTELLARVAAAEPDVLLAAGSAIEAIDRLSASLGTRIGAGVLSLDPLRRLLEPVDRASAAARGTQGFGPPASAGGAEAVLAENDGAPLRSRMEAAAALERVAQFVERSEPGHPAPLLIRRAKQLIGMSFLELMTELAPESVPGIRALAGVRDTSG